MHPWVIVLDTFFEVCFGNKYHSFLMLTKNDLQLMYMHEEELSWFFCDLWFMII